tara:strand:+ start:434 stop:1111 length:678 start_codon:yes stop_codon:yes gene_type:complete
MKENKKIILVVDDEKDIVDLLSYNLTKNNYKVITASDGSEALLKVNSKIDLIILDVMMPKLDGYDVCDVLKKNPATSDIPIIFLTALSSTEDEYKGLLKGGNDYIKKPVAIENLLLRVKNLLKTNKKNANIVSSKSLNVDFENLTVYNRDEKISLTKIEFNLLSVFIKKPGKVFTRNELLDKVWGQETIVSDRTVDVHVTKLRKKIESNEKIIFTSHGRGYYFED